MKITMSQLINGQAQIVRAGHYDFKKPKACQNVVRFAGRVPTGLKRWCFVKQFDQEMILIMTADTLSEIVNTINEPGATIVM